MPVPSCPLAHSQSARVRHLPPSALSPALPPYLQLVLLHCLLEVHEYQAPLIHYLVTPALSIDVVSHIFRSLSWFDPPPYPAMEGFLNITLVHLIPSEEYAILEPLVLSPNATNLFPTQVTPLPIEKIF